MQTRRCVYSDSSSLFGPNPPPLGRVSLVFGAQAPASERAFLSAHNVQRAVFHLRPKTTREAVNNVAARSCLLSIYTQTHTLINLYEYIFTRRFMECMVFLFLDPLLRDY